MTTQDTASRGPLLWCYGKPSLCYPIDAAALKKATL